MYNGDLYLAMQIFFTLSFFMTLGELVVFYFWKVANVNIEINAENQRPYVSSTSMKAIGIFSVMLAITAVIIGT